MTIHALLFGFDLCRSGNPTTDKGTRDYELVTCEECRKVMAERPHLVNIPA